MPYKYQPFAQEDVASAEESLARSGQSRWKAKVGQNIIRILPNATPGAPFWLEVGQHFNVGPDRKKVFACPRRTGVSDDCYLCDLVSALYDGDDEDKEEAKEIGVRTSWLMNIVDLKDPDRGIQQWYASKTAFTDIFTYVKDPEYNDGFIDDPENGYNIKVGREGEKKEDTKYQCRAAKNATPFDYPELLDDIPPLEDFMTYSSNEDMEVAYKGYTDEGDEVAPEQEFDGEDTPAGFDDDDAPVAAADEAEEEAPAEEEATAEEQASAEEQEFDGDDAQVEEAADEPRPARPVRRDIPRPAALPKPAPRPAPGAARPRAVVPQTRKPAATTAAPKAAPKAATAKPARATTTAAPAKARPAAAARRVVDSALRRGRSK